MKFTPEVRKWFEHIQKQGWTVERKQGWIEDLKKLTLSRDQFGTVSEKVPLFWIRLRGVVGELRDEAKKQLQTLTWAKDGVSDAAQRGENFDRTFEMMTTFAAAHDQLRHALDEEDAVLVDFMRHIHSHPMVDSYLYQLRAKGTAIDTEYRPRLLAKEYDRETLLRIIEKKLADHGGEEGAAFAIAAKIEPLVVALCKAAEPLFEPG
jgi:hypothetical protein